MLAVGMLGVLQIVETGENIQSVADLRGKTIYTVGQAANPEYVLNYVLRQNGLTPGTDVTVKFAAENEELATLLANGGAEVAMVPEPFATSVKAKNQNLRAALDVSTEWEKVGGGSRLMMSCVVVRNEFLEQNGEAVKAFLTEYAASIYAANHDAAATAELCVKYNIVAAAPIAQAAIPGCHLQYVDGADMKAQIGGYFQVLFESDAAAIGGKLPDDGFYYMG